MSNKTIKPGNSLKKLTGAAIFASFAIILSYVEGFLPPLMPAIHGIKLGLANISVMLCVLIMGARSGFLVVIVKSLFVMLNKGSVAFVLSLCGGISSLFIIAILIFASKKINFDISILFLSVMGAVVHNMAQLIVATIFYTKNIFLFYVFPMIIFGIIAGVLNALILRAVSPIINAENLKRI